MDRPEIKFVNFNLERHKNGKPAARYRIDNELKWLSRASIGMLNMYYGRCDELNEGFLAYQRWEVVK